MSLPAAANIGVLLLLLYVLFAILGMQLFGTARLQDPIYWTKPLPQNDRTCTKFGKELGCFCEDADIVAPYPPAGCARFVFVIVFFCFRLSLIEWSIQEASIVFMHLPSRCLTGLSGGIDTKLGTRFNPFNTTPNGVERY